jgi:hypothetical protein
MMALALALALALAGDLAFLLFFSKAMLRYEINLCLQGRPAIFFTQLRGFKGNALVLK